MKQRIQRKKLSSICKQINVETPFSYGLLHCVLGFIQEDYLRELLTTMGDRFTDEEVDELYREAPIDKKGNFNYIEFTRILKHGAKDKDD